MKKGLTELVFILDSSGSMADMVSDTIGGFNSMIEKQKKEEGEALVSTVLFNTRHRVIHDRVSLAEIEPLTERDYVAGGCTALIDAIGRAVHHISNVHKYIREEDVPEHTLFVITTDGLENASRQYSSDQVKEMIKQKKSEGWEFLFLAANIDAVETAARFGIDRDHSANFHNDTIGIATNYDALDKAVKDIRCSRMLSGAWKKGIDEDFEERNK